MKLTAKPLVIAAFFGLWAGVAQAITVDELVKTFQGQSYGHIEVKEGPNQIKVEAIKDGQQVEAIYDKASGAELKRQTAATTQVGRPGVEIARSDDDFNDHTMDDNGRKRGCWDDVLGDGDGRSDHENDRGHGSHD